MCPVERTLLFLGYVTQVCAKVRMKAWLDMRYDWPDFRTQLGMLQPVRRTQPPLELGLVFTGAGLLPGVRSQDYAGGILGKEP